MSELQRGGNATVEAATVTVAATWSGPASLDADVTAYLLRADGKVRGDQDMVFYNQPSGGNGAVVLAGQGRETSFSIDFGRMPGDIDRIVFCLTIDQGKERGQAFADLTAAEIAVEAAGRTLVKYLPERAEAREAALILGELYRRNSVWKFRAVGQGFDGGLAPLARHFGIAVDEPAAPPPPPPAPRPSPTVDLQKKVAAKAPQLVDLAKAASVSLEKKQLGGIKAQVVLVLDASGSMAGRYNNGTVQQVVDRILPLAVHFDDDGALDVWAYANKAAPLTPITLDNVEGYIAREQGGWRKWPLGLRGNNEPEVIRPLMDRFRSMPLATYIVFISDGGVNQNRKIEQLLREAADLPIFWQFVGIGGRNYGIFETLDTMTGRRIDNCNFFALDDLKSVSDAELYDRLLGEFPQWLVEARKAGVLR